MKKIILILILGIFFKSHSQHFEGYVITNNNDTIKCKFVNISNMFYETILNPASIRSSVKILREDGSKVKFKPSDLISFLIKDVKNPNGFQTNNKDLKFVSLKQDNYKHFYQENYVGKISYYTVFNQTMNASYTRQDIYIKDNEIKKMNPFSIRKDAGNLIIDDTELYNKWMNEEYYKLKEINNVFLLYNENKK